jgi:hypothetical protein
VKAVSASSSNSLAFRNVDKYIDTFFNLLAS